MSTADKMQSINTRIDDLTKELADLAERRDALSLAAAQGNKNALREIAQCDEAETKAKRELGMLTSAMTQLKQLAAEEQQQILDKVERERQIKAADLAKTICDTNSAVDSKLQELRNLLELRADNLNQLKMLGVTDAMYLNKMRDLPNGAFAAAGLGKFVNLHTPSPQAIRPLGASNGFFNSIGKKLKADVE